MNKFLIICCCFLSTSALANWEKLNESFMSVDSGLGVFEMVVGKTDKGYMIFFLVRNAQCEGDMRVGGFKIYDKTLPGIHRCDVNGDLMMIPSTQVGQDYTINEFKLKNTVEIGGIEFSAKGFTKNFNELK